MELLLPWTQRMEVFVFFSPPLSYSQCSNATNGELCRRTGRLGRPEVAAAPVEELAKSLHGLEVFDLRGKAKDRKFLSCFGRLIVFETIDAGCLQVVLCRKRADLLAAKQVSLVADSSLRISRNKENTSNAQSDAFFYSLYFFQSTRFHLQKHKMFSF
uniref:Uncharacterized protein n=1 Tax=Oryza rufipogon TaxID=4529 RepID=A0A0E0NGL6_ORYRU